MENNILNLTSTELKAKLELFNTELEPLDVKLMPALNMTLSKEEYERNLVSVLGELRCALLDEKSEFITDNDQLYQRFVDVYKSTEMI